MIEGTAAAGFSDSSLWEEAKKRPGAIKKLIDDALDGTSVTVVLIGSQTAGRTWINYEIEKSIERGNGILGVLVNHLEDRDKRTDPVGTVPEALRKIGAPIYKYEYGKLGQWVEEAYQRARG